MLRIGLVGTQSSHAEAFLKACNCPGEDGKLLYDDLRITAVCGSDDTPEHINELAKKANDPFIARDISEMFDKVDAVMFLQRRGSERIKTVLPFIEKGFPCWLDKPVCSSLEDLELLKSYVDKYKPLISGGSTLRYHKDVIRMKNNVESGKYGKVKSGYVNHFADWSSPYDGFYFYSPHALEMAFAVFGYSPEKISAVKLDDLNTNLTLRYSDKLVVVSFNENNEHYITVNGSEGLGESVTMDPLVLYRYGLEGFVSDIKRGKTDYGFDKLTAHVRVIAAAEESLKTGKEISI